MNIVVQFYEEYKKWKEAGAPLRTPEKIVELFEICSSCEHYEGINEIRGHCGICKCNLKKQGKILNKLAWATTNCADNPPRWIAEANLENLEKADDFIQTQNCGCGK